MKIDILTLFPNMFKGPFDYSIIRRAQDKSLVQIKIHDLRKWATDKRGTVDDRPFGGGVGMIMRVDVIDNAISKIKSQKSKIILLSPRGKMFNQKIALQLSKLNHLVLLCGHYEGVDERVSQYLIDEEISIGDYVLTGGELPAMVIVDSVIRLIPRVLKKSEATKDESFSPLLEYPQYTQPANYKDWMIPEVLLSGNHQKVASWRQQQSLKITQKRRPDLLLPAK